MLGESKSSELQLSEDLNVITAEIQSYKQIAGQSIFEIGRRLKHVKENDLVHGEWIGWLSSINMDRSEAHRYIQVTERIGIDNVETFQHLGLTALNLIATLPEKEREKEHVTSKGETKTVDEMTVRELQEIKRQLKEEKQAKQQVEQQVQVEQSERERLEKENEKLVNQEPKIIEKEVIKEVDNTDYNLQDKLNDTIHKLEEKLDLASRKHSLLERKLEQEKEEASEYRRINKELGDLHKEKSDLHRQIESASSISGLVVEIENLLMYKLAPIEYSRALQEQKDSQVVIDNVWDILDRVKKWHDEMTQIMPRRNDYVDIVDAEIIDQ